MKVSVCWGTNCIQFLADERCVDMPKFRENRISLLYAHSLDLIDEEEFVLLYDLNTSGNPDIPYWNYDKFDLDLITDDECKNEFRFFRKDMYLLHEILDIPEEITLYNGTYVDGIEALSILLKRFAYPCRYLDLVPRFARPIPQLCMVSNHLMNLIYSNWHHLLTNFQQPWLSPANLQQFADAIHQKGAPLDNCFGFVDGTVRPVSRPGRNQRVLYNGHKRFHSIKFQSIATPSGIVANLYGPVEGKRHDSGMLVESQVLNQLQQHAFGPAGNVLCMYGDPAYPLRPQLQGPFKGAHITQLQKAWDKSMSQVRISVEWIFGDIANYFKFLDFKKNLKVQLSAVGKMYIVCVLLQNARSCLYGSVTSDYFGLPPPTLKNYFL